MKESAKTYILSKLTNLVKEISNLMILYKYDNFSKEHLIKVLPLNEYEKNQDYHKFEEDILFDFISKYPYDSLVFLSENDWIDIGKPDEVIEGKNYYEEISFPILSKSLIDVFKNDNLFSFSNIEVEDSFNITGILDFITENENSNSNSITDNSNYNFALAA